jgi:hypothetical protein
MRALSMAVTAGIGLCASSATSTTTSALPSFASCRGSRSRSPATGRLPVVDAGLGECGFLVNPHFIPNAPSAGVQPDRRLLLLAHLIHAPGSAHADFDGIGLHVVIVGLASVSLHCDADIADFLNCTEAEDTITVQEEDRGDYGAYK